jgi:D-serine deaminase-like pyridoxal phosphate-dependent protein
MRGEGMKATELDTPALYVDLDVLERNIRTMQARCREWGVALRPHTKTHKTPEIAAMQLAAGAAGITCAKIGEAEVLPGDDVLIGFPVPPQKLPRLRELARTRRVTVVTDSVEFARALPGIGTLVEIDVGVGRCGVQTPEEAVAVARACTDFRGLFYYPASLDDAAFEAARQKIDATLVALHRAGFKTPIVSGGSTPGAPKTSLIPATTEIRPGTYVFQDKNCMVANCCTEADCALRMLVSVVSTAVPGQCIIDGGSKTFSSDSTKGEGTFGHFVGRNWTMTKMNEEHGYVSLDGSRADVGEKVWVIPSHVCPAVNLQDEMWYGRKGIVEGKWRIAGRGKVR